MNRTDCEKYAEEHNLSLGDDTRVDGLLKGVNKNIETYGKGYCPCRIGHKDEDVCPCAYNLEECATKGKCLCGMFKKKD